MSAQLDTERLGLVFQSRPDILQGIQRAADSPGKIALFNEIATFVHDRLQGSDEPAQKRRKVDNGSTNGVATPPVGIVNAADEAVLLEVKEISVSVPQRKKLELCFTANHIYARTPGTTVPLPGTVYPWRDVEHIFYLPVPEKAQVQHNYVLFPRGSCIPSKTDPPSTEPLVFTVPATAPKAGTIGGKEASTAESVSDTYKSLFHWAFGRRLGAAGSKTKIVSADPNKFASVIRQPHRPNEKAVHVGGYRGSKDGFLFFLENGILWGFKKPLLFIPLDRVVAVSYTNILQITFNIVVEVFSGDGDATEEIEFSMLDQQDYGGIDAYIKLNGLQDRSMAEQRKAKLQLAENRAKKGEEVEGAAEAAVAGQPEDGMTELERAQHSLEQQLMDDEDEDEEDYDPGSDGDSGGSGESSDDDDDDDDDDDEDDPEDEDAEGEEQEGQEEEGEEEVEEEEEEKQEVRQEPVAAPKPASVPVRQGWAAISNPRPASNRMDVDEEKFDVVG